MQKRAGRSAGRAPYLPTTVYGFILGLLTFGGVLTRLAFNITDVRDLADLHVRAMEAPGAAGQRFIALGEALWHPQVAHILRDRLADKAAKVPTRKLPDVAFRTLAMVNPQMKALLPLLCRTQAFSADRARQALGYAPRPAADTVADCAASLAT